MKKAFLLILLIITCLVSKSQNNGAKVDDIGRIACSVYIDETKTVIPKNAYNILKNKLTQIVAKNGMASSMPQRFIVTANVDVLTKDITPTAPPMQAFTLKVNFYIGDGVSGTLFESASITSKGVGETEDKAYIAALKAVKINSPEIINMLEHGKQKIIEYFNTQCDFIISDAESKVSMEKYDEAIIALASVPDVCKDCYEKVMKSLGDVYIQKIDAENYKKFMEAKNIWNASQDEKGAETASALLSEINPAASCFSDAVNLGNQIAKALKEKYDKEMELKFNEQKNAHEQEMARIAANKETEMAKIEANKTSSTAESTAKSDNSSSSSYYSYVDDAVASVAAAALETAIVYSALSWW